MSGFCLDVAGVSGGYGSGLVVKAIGLRLRPGEVVCVLGRNGVGKSTLLKLIAGQLGLSAGSVHLGQTDVSGWTTSQRSRHGLTYCPQERCVFDDLTVAENLTLMRPSRSLEPFAALLDVFPRLRERLGQHAGTLSGGEKKLLSLTRGLGENSQVTLIDEPTEGVQYENVRLMADLINDRKARGSAFLIVEQNLTLVDAVADRLIVLDHGDVVLEGRASAIERDDILRHLVV